MQTISSAFPVQGQAGSSRLSYSQRTVVDSIDDFNGSYDSSVGLSQILPNTSPTGGVSTELISVANDPWSDATKYKFLEALKFVELADNCVDAFFDQISFSVGTTKVETIQDPQLTQTMRQRVKSGALSNAYRQDQLGGYKDEQSHNNLSGNLGDKSDQSLFSLLGYENIHIEGAATDVNYPQEFTKRTFTVEFDILYRPALAIFRYSHALPAARYEVEFKGVASQSQFQNNFFHCTRPGGLGRWAMTHSADRAGNLVNGPAQKYDGRVMQEYRTIGTHASHQLFFFEPISGHGPNHHKDVMDSYLFGRQGYSSVDLTHQRLDPGVWVSANLIDMWLEMAVIEGPETTQTDFVLAFDHLQPVYQTLTFGSDQTLTYDVDARANTFFFGFRSTTVDNDCCLQAGHLLTKGNTERDLDQYHINFDLKTRPQNYATHINLRSVRGATNEQLRSQINTMVHFKGYPETPRSWMKKGPYFAYYWPRSANANATRFTLNLRLRNNKQDREFGTYGPYGQFEYETPIVTANYNLPRVDPRKSPTEIEVSRTSGVVGYVGQYRNNRINTTATEYAGFYLRPTVYSAPANQAGLANGFYDFKEEPTGYVPYWSVEVPQSLRLQ
ncbi:hypothetical protein N9K11_01610, partial [bacterium]|nr:hypothetical protein [bacterium]